MSPNSPQDGKPGTTEQSPRWEGPEENRPRGYLPANDDPYNEEDAAGETLKHPDRQTLADALATRNNPPPPREAGESDERSDSSLPPFTDPAFSSEPAGRAVRPDAPFYKEPPKDTEFAGHPDFSQDAAANKPPRGMGNSEPVDDVVGKARRSEGLNPVHPSPRQTTGTGPALARHPKDV